MAKPYRAHRCNATAQDGRVLPLQGILVKDLPARE
jgi:hypothetical protein